MKAQYGRQQSGYKKKFKDKRFGEAKRYTKPAEDKLIRGRKDQRHILKRFRRWCRDYSDDPSEQALIDDMRQKTWEEYRSVREIWLVNLFDPNDEGGAALLTKSEVDSLSFTPVDYPVDYAVNRNRIDAETASWLARQPPSRRERERREAAEEQVARANNCLHIAVAKEQMMNTENCLFERIMWMDRYVSLGGR